MNNKKIGIIVGIAIVVIGIVYFAMGDTEKDIPLVQATEREELVGFDETLEQYKSVNLENADVLFEKNIVTSDRVTLSGSVVTISQGGEYVISGSTKDGQVIVDSGDEEVTLILNGVDITNQNGAAIYIKKSGDVEVFLAQDSINRLVDGSGYGPSEDEEDQTAPLFSKSDLKIDGGKNSILNIIGNYNDGIVSKDDLKIRDVTINIKSVDDGIRGKDSLDIKDSVITIVAEDDALKSDNETDENRGIITLESSDITISAGDDAIHATNLVEIISGNITITDSYEGIEAKVITIHDGVIDIVASDDGINVAKKESTEEESSTVQQRGFGGGMNSVLDGGELNIYGGLITINAQGDGFDSNGNATMTGGTLIVNGPTGGGDGPLDVNGTFLVSGGTIIAVGSSGMAETPDGESKQLSIQVNFDEMKEVGTVVSLQDKQGGEIFTFTPEKTFQSVTYSSDKLVQGDTYTFFVDGEKYVDLVLEDIVTKYGEGSRMGGGERPEGEPGGDFQGGQRPNMDFPDDWDTMTEDQRRAFFEANRPQPAN